MDDESYLLRVINEEGAFPLVRLLTYGFPFILIAIEYVLRLALQSDTSGFVGPALASAGAGLVVPLVAPKSRISELPDDVAQELKRLNVTVRSRRDEIFGLVCVLLLLSSLAVWEWCMILAEKKDLTLILGFSRPLVIGLFSYFVAVIAAEIKEAL